MSFILRLVIIIEILSYSLEYKEGSMGADAGACSIPGIFDKHSLWLLAS